MATSGATSGKNSLDWTIPTFVDHFKKNDVLEIPPNTEFILKRVDLIQDRNLPWEQERPVEKLSDLIDRYFNPILSVLGKKLEIDRKGDSKEGIDVVTGDITMRSNLKMTMRAQRTNIIQTRITDLFRSMAYCSMSTVTFDSDQTVEVKLTEDELRSLCFEEKSYDIFVSLINRRMFPSYSCRLKVPRNYINLSLQKVQRPNFFVDDARLTLSCKEGFELQLVDKLHFDSVEAFRQRFRLSRQITIPAGKSLRIDDVYFRRYRDRIAGEQFLLMVLNDLVAPLAQAISINFSLYSLEINDQSLIVKVEADAKIFINSKIKTSVVKDCRDFVYSISKSGQALIIPADHQLIFYEVSEDRSTDLIKFLSRHTPVGFTWVHKYGQMTCSIQNETTYFRSLTPIYLSLVSMPGDVLIKLMLESSSPVLTTRLREGTQASSLFILFKAIFYLTHSDNIPDEFPTYFKAATLIRMKEAKKYKKPTPEESVLLERVLKLDPEEFEKLNIKNLPTWLDELMTPILALATEELKQGPLNESIAQVAFELRQKTTPRKSSKGLLNSDKI